MSALMDILRRGWSRLPPVAHAREIAEWEAALDRGEWPDKIPAGVAVTFEPYCVACPLKQGDAGEPDGGADGDGEHDRPGESETPFRLLGRVSDSTEMPDTVSGGAPCGQAKTPTEHDQGDTSCRRDVGRDFHDKGGDEEQKPEDAHGGEPLSLDQLGEAVGRAAQRSFHARFLSRLARVGRCAGGRSPAHIPFWRKSARVHSGQPSSDSRAPAAHKTGAIR